MAKPQFDGVLAHWATLIDGFQTSSLEFYGAVEAALSRREIPTIRFSRVDYQESGVLSNRREYLRVTRHHLRFDICAAPFGTGFFFSWWQVRPPLRFGLLFGLILVAFELFITHTLYKYLAHQQVLHFAPFWWKFGLATFGAFLAFLFLCCLACTGGDILEDFLLPIPVVGAFYQRFFNPMTYYEMDTTAMYRALVHAAVLEVIDGLTNSKGIRALAEHERKPILREFFQQ
jgi:hypothetical protein